MDKEFQEAINKARRLKKRGNRTARINFRVSPEEKRIIEEKFGSASGLRDFALGISAAAAVDLFIEDFQERLKLLEELKNETD
jgi:hypothetical protein